MIQTFADAETERFFATGVNLNKRHKSPQKIKAGLIKISIRSSLSALSVPLLPNTQTQRNVRQPDQSQRSVEELIRVVHRAYMSKNNYIRNKQILNRSLIEYVYRVRTH